MSRTVALVWVLPNILGIIAFLYFSSWGWVLPQAPAGGPGDPIIWMLTAFPAMAACFTLDVAWLIRIIVKRDMRWKHAVVWLLCVVAWCSAYRYNFNYNYGDSLLNARDIVLAACGRRA